jgi:maltose alpha-D-glucosyltransferase/alpha-amylase
VAYAVPLPGAPDVLIAEVETRHGGQAERYVLPLGIAWDSGNTLPLAQQLALARVRLIRRVGLITDAFAVDEFAHAVLANLLAGAKIDLPQGELRFEATSFVASIEMPEQPEIRRFAAEQSNSSLVMGDRVVLKIVRHVSPGVHPEGEMTRFLTEKGFGNTAALVGEVVRVDPDGTPNTLMLVQNFVRNQGDAWTWTLDFLARAVEELAVTGQQDRTQNDLFATYTGFATALGQRLGELHALLAQPTENPDFAPEIADAAIAEEWAESAIEQIRLAFALLTERRDWPDAESETLAKALLRQGDALERAVRDLAKQGIGSVRTRIHGDFHLGQVLVVQNDAYIIDFEGEPARPLHQRRMKSSGLRDVAGILRSFDYATAAAAAAPGTNALSPQAAERHGVLLEQFREQAARVFLAAYRATLETAVNPWVGAGAEAPLLDLFLLEKAAYEVRYEVANRPAWLRIPLRGLHDIATRLLVTGEVA